MTNTFKSTLQRLEAQTLAQSAASDAIANNFSKGLKNKIVSFGIAAFFGLTTLTSSNVAMADSNGILSILGLSGIGGLLLDGSKPSDLSADCEGVRGVNGYQVAGAVAAGGAAGSIFKEKNRATAQVLLAGVAGGAVYAKERSRITNECEAAIRKADQVRANEASRQAQLNNVPSYGNPGVVYGANAVPRMPTEPILFLQREQNGNVTYITVSNSIGVSALNGYRNGSKSVDSDPVVKTALDKAFSNFETSYHNLDKASQQALDFRSGKDDSVKSARYSLEPEKGNVNNATLQGKSKQLSEKIDSSFNSYAEHRAVALKIAQEATIDGFDLSKYSKSLDYIDVPQTLRQVYYNNGSQLNNRYPNNPYN